VRRAPGHYCCHCGEALPNANQLDDGVSLGTKHVRSRHAGEKSPDANNLSGYERINHYDCVLDAKQHAKFKTVPFGAKKEG